MSVLGNPLLLGPEGYQISRSVRLRSSASGYFSRTFSNAATNNLKGSLSIWTKRGTLGAQVDLISCYNGSSSASTDLYFNTSNQLQFDFGNTAANSLITTAVYRDPSAWYHIHLEVDTTQATASNRVKLYVNGVQVTAFGTANYPAQNTVFQIVSVNANNRIGTNWNNSGAFFDGYLTEVNFIDGQALTPSSFGETDSITGVWKPKKYTGTYGTNGFYLNFSDNSSNTATTIGKDYSGNGNNWTPNNISVTSGATYDSMLDVPTLYADGGNGRGNYAVLNPLAKLFGSPTFADGNLRTTAVGCISSSTMALPTSGKWYAEATVSGKTSTVTAGICNQSPSRTQVIEYYSDGQKNLSGTLSAYGATYTTNDVIGIAVDCDAATVTFYKNNASQGAINFSAASLTTAGDIVFECYTGSGSDAWVFNFGQRPFSYTPPTGFKALNTQNLPEPTIKKGNQYFDVSLYTGNGSSGGQTITNSGAMQPDFVWLKARSLAGEHQLFDAVRGGTKYLVSNNTNAEQTGAGITFNSNGFALAGAQYNDNAMTVASWQWKESPSAGFDIVTYTGTGANRTVAHSLGVAPRMMIVKNRTNGSAAYHWFVYHASVGATDRLLLNTTGATATDSAAWNNTAPTSSVFSVGTGVQTNESGSSFVAYLFAEVAGFSKFGSYTGNGSADGPFVFCGFRPRYVMIKRTDSTGDWFVFDTARNTFNTMSSFLRPNWSDAEATNTNHSIDLLSNGFKSRAIDAAVNASGGTFIYAAFSEHPFKNSLAR